MGGAFLVAVGGVAALLSGVVQSRLACAVVGTAWVCVVLLYPAVAIANGYSPTQSGIDYKSKSPVAFWSGLVTYTLVLALFAAAAIVYVVAKFNQLPG
jgi:fumarate reductase subunit C